MTFILLILLIPLLLISLLCSSLSDFLHEMGKEERLVTLANRLKSLLKEKVEEKRAKILCIDPIPATLSSPPHGRSSLISSSSFCCSFLSCSFLLTAFLSSSLWVIAHMSQDIAQQMCLIDFHLFAQIEASELLDVMKEKRREERCRHILIAILLFSLPSSLLFIA